MSTQTIDDQDPFVQYSAGWLMAGSSNEFDDTTSEANRAGLTATLQFSGTGIKVFGTIPDIGTGTSPMSSYGIDGTTAGSFTGIQQTYIQYKVLYFQSHPLSDGNHTLVVTNTGNSTAFFYLDFFEISGSTPLTSSTSTTGTSSSSPTSSSIGTLSATVAVTSPNASTSFNVSMPSDVTSNSSKPGKSSSSPGIAIILGGVLGGVFVLGVLSFFVFCSCRNRKTSISNAGSRVLPLNGSHLVSEPLLPPGQLTQISPFNLLQRSNEHLSNPFASKRSQSPYTRSPFSSLGGQSHSTAAYEQTVSPASDVALSGTMRDALSSVHSSSSTAAAQEAGTLTSNPLVHPASSAQSDMAYDPPPRYNNNS